MKNDIREFSQNTIAPDDDLPEGDAPNDLPVAGLVWRLKSCTLNLSTHPLLMGIVNVTPDSFSDGGCFFETQRAIEHGIRLAEEGADIIDVGGESTRPGSDPVDAEEELRRIVPVVSILYEHFSRQKNAPVISIDTTKAVVAKAALNAGAEIINDVSALTDPRMLGVLLGSGAGICVMHSQGTPKTMQDCPEYPNGNPVPVVLEFLRERIRFLESHGVTRERIAVDPGIGFGKTFEHNMRLLQEMETFHELGCPVLVGHSRKRFLARILGDPHLNRTEATISVSRQLIRQGVAVLRAHDIKEHIDLLFRSRVSGF